MTPPDTRAGKHLRPSSVRARQDPPYRVRVAHLVRVRELAAKLGLPVTTILAQAIEAGLLALETTPAQAQREQAAGRAALAAARVR